MHGTEDGGHLLMDNLTPEYGGAMQVGFRSLWLRARGLKIMFE